MEPPIHTEYFLSFFSIIFIFIYSSSNSFLSFFILSFIFFYIFYPPYITIFYYISFLISTSHFIIYFYFFSFIPFFSLPISDGWNSTSGQRKRSLPMVII
eukprot:gnl/Spiro4/5834_TR2976_c0_g1_i1.p1 gnl/Spiro4/5834_TR2976_c0_g1~~gnl/Spiro4/5834_TR2976_c0_g1_i1.p1  ORF type:complete len:100 (+),score=1.53 gnl/Spiro4/5834_TR2976_c0_g1_i1:3-302(+)